MQEVPGFKSRQPDQQIDPRRTYSPRAQGSKLRKVDCLMKLWSVVERFIFRSAGLSITRRPPQFTGIDTVSSVQAVLNGQFECTRLVKAAVISMYRLAPIRGPREQGHWAASRRAAFCADSYGRGRFGILHQGFEVLRIPNNPNAVLRPLCGTTRDGWGTVCWLNCGIGRSALILPGPGWFRCHWRSEERCLAGLHRQHAHLYSEAWSA